MTIFPSACVWNFDGELGATLRQVKETAFHYIDIEPRTLEAAAQTWKDLGLRVSCVALDHGLPPGISLPWNDAANSRKAIEYFRHALQKSAESGVRYAYLASCTNTKQIAVFESSVVALAETAATGGIKLCIEHTPGRALATAGQARAFVERLNHPNLFVLVDVGHTLLSGEKPSEAVSAAGARLGYIQMNDNDGKRDRHWPLLDGKLTLAELRATISALQLVGYDGTIGLELNRDFASWISGMSKNRNLLLRLQETAEAKSFQEPESRRKN